MPRPKRLITLADCVRSALFVLALSFLAVPTTQAQNPHDGADVERNLPDVPAGEAAIFGQLRHPGGNDKATGATVVLYSLAADGSPGVRTSAAAEDGTFRFSDLSNAPGITYLVGASYRAVPYGKRVAFEPGQSEITLVIDVDDPVSDTSRISVGESSLRLEWVGARVGVEEIHQLQNSGDEVIFVSPDERSHQSPAFRTQLPPGATEINTSLSGIEEGFEVNDGELRFYGPVYAGGHELRFRYLLPIDRSVGDEMSLRWALEAGSRRATLLYPATGPTLSVAGLTRGSDVNLDGRILHSIDAGPVSAHASLDVAIALPVMSNDRTAISIPRADYWLDADDTVLQVNVDASIVVAEGAHLTGSNDDPLLTFDLPPGSEFLGYSKDSQSVGLVLIGDGDLGVIGPLSPGTANVAFRFRVAVEDRNPSFELRAPGAIDVLNVLIADTGVAISTDRLHRRRPFRQGPRVYLHREAFAVEAGEVIPIGLDLIDRGTLGRNTHLFAASVLAALGAWFIVAPLVRRRQTSVLQFEQARIRSERDLVYQAIRDLDHDYETAKIEEAEYTTMRADLRARGLELLKQARDSEVDSAPPVAETEAAFCAECGTALDGNWAFCAKCGARCDAAGDSAKADP